MNTRTRTLAAAALAVAWLGGPSAAHAQRQSGIQLTPDSSRYLISKDVGDERWAISYNTDDRTVTGNVFPMGMMGSPQFVWCTTTSVDQAPDPANAQYHLHCQFAQPCASAPCADAAWNVSAPADVVVPGSFLLPPQTRATLAGNVQPTLDTSCSFSAACHSGSLAPDLKDGRTWASVFDVDSSENPTKPYAAPFRPDDSYLLDKVLGVQSAGGQMPLGLAPLDASQVDAIRNWIREGAVDN